MKGDISGPVRKRSRLLPGGTEGDGNKCEGALHGLKQRLKPGMFPECGVGMQDVGMRRNPIASCHVLLDSSGYE